MNGCESFITNPLGLTLLCTLESGHYGHHVAYMTGGGVAASWAEPTPRPSWLEPTRPAVSR